MSIILAAKSNKFKIFLLYNIIMQTIIKTKTLDREIKTKIINNTHKNTLFKDIKTKILDNRIDTKVISEPILTKIINKDQKESRNNTTKNKIINMLIPPELRGGEIKEIPIKEKKSLNIVSYIDNKKRKIYLKKLINNGSYNSIYEFSKNKNEKIDTNLVARISLKQSTVENINVELKGIKTQYMLCQGVNNIGNIIDYGMIHNPSTSNTYRLQEYSIIEKYGIDLKKLLENSPKYENIGVVINFMKNFLLDLKYIHSKGYAHLDIKPSNILLKNFNSIPRNQILSLDYAIVDFGGARKFKNDKSIMLDGQMASAAFSPPELLNQKFGKKSDIWAFGIISYLILVRKFFFKAKAQQIFMSQNKDELKRNIKNAIKNIAKSIKPRYIKDSQSLNSYFYPVNGNNIDILKNFLEKVFTINSLDRPCARELLNHPLFLYN